MNTIMKTIGKFLFVLMFIAMNISISSCDRDDSPTTEKQYNNNTEENDKGVDEEPQNYQQFILGTWKCNMEDGYTIITFKDNGISEWKYQLDEDISKWTTPYKITSEFLCFEVDGKEEKYEYKLTKTSLFFDGDDYVKIDNYTEEDDPTEKEEESYDNRGAVANQFRGKGTKAEPYIISDATELRKLADDVESGKSYRDEYFKMTANVIVNKKVINTNGMLAVGASSLEQWKPIGNSLTPFCGTFDGNGHTISGIFIQKTDRDSLGLFGNFAGTITDLEINDSYIEGKGYIGGLIGVANPASYSKTYIPSITSCKNYSVVKSNDGTYTGGLVGYSHRGTIDKCINYGPINGYKDVGGIIGANMGAYVKNCLNYGPISGDNNVAGIAAYSIRVKRNNTWYHSYVWNCLNCGTITSNGNVGGIIGSTGHSIGSEKYINNVVNYGKIQITSDNTHIGALIGYLRSGSIAANGYYLETSYPVGIGKIQTGTATNIQSMTSNQMHTQSFLDELNKNAKALGSSCSKWIFGNDGYPILN